MTFVQLPSLPPFYTVTFLTNEGINQISHAKLVNDRVASVISYLSKSKEVILWSAVAFFFSLKL